MNIGAPSRSWNAAWISVIILTAASANAALDRQDLNRFLDRPAARAYADSYFADKDAFRRDLLKRLRDSHALRNVTHLDHTAARLMQAYRLYFGYTYRNQKLSEDHQDILRSFLKDRSLYRGLRFIAGLTMYIKTGNTRYALDAVYAFPERFTMFTKVKDDSYRLFTRMLLSDLLSERLSGEASRKHVFEFVEESMQDIVDAMLFQQVGEHVRNMWWKHTMPYLQSYTSKASLIGKIILDHSEKIATEYVRALFESQRYAAIKALKSNLPEYEPIIEIAARDYLQEQQEDVRQVEEIAPNAKKATENE